MRLKEGLLNKACSVHAVHALLQMLDRIASPETGYLALRPGARVALLINNLGRSTPMELHIATRAALQQLRDRHQASCRPPNKRVPIFILLLHDRASETCRGYQRAGTVPGLLLSAPLGASPMRQKTTCTPVLAGGVQLV